MGRGLRELGVRVGNGHTLRLGGPLASAAAISETRLVCVG